MASKKRKSDKDDIATQNYLKGLEIIGKHPLFAPLEAHARFIRGERSSCPETGWAVVTENGTIHVHPTCRLEPEEWSYVLAHCLLHLGFDHFRKDKRRWEWNMACDSFITRFLTTLRFGRPPKEFDVTAEIHGRTEEHLYQQFCEQGVPEQFRSYSTSGNQSHDMFFVGKAETYRGHNIDWKACFGKGLALAVRSAVKVAAGYDTSLGSTNDVLSPVQRARSWFLSSFPLLGALAATFEIVEDPVICQRLHISVAAIDEYSQEIFMNPAAGLDEYECRFVMAHELLHAGLRHQGRCQGRDFFLWNVACDFVVNGWLVEMGLGTLPKIGALYDPDLKGESAEAVYDRIVTDLRRGRKLATLCGVGLPDILVRKSENTDTPDAVDLDEWYRRSLSQGLSYHEEQGRGYLPLGLVEEIRALSQPPIPWDVQLAKWFDGHFAPIEKARTFARPSRRQSATPDIPRPRWFPTKGAEDGRTFGVVLDTSGSMDRAVLANALGAIASYSIARDVPAVRVVFCDAAVYDQGYLTPDAIADRVQVKGRGGTTLQPAIQLLDRAEDFPKDGPLLIITDGFCDRLTIRRNHAFLMPVGRHLPFVPKGPVFRIK